MNTTPNRYELGLAARGLLEIPDVCGVQVSCTEGSVWLTLDNDPRDIVLEPGDMFFGTEHKRALLYAFAASTVALRAQSGKRTLTHAPSISFAPSPAPG